MVGEKPPARGPLSGRCLSQGWLGMFTPLGRIFARFAQGELHMHVRNGGV